MKTVSVVLEFVFAWCFPACFTDFIAHINSRAAGHTDLIEKHGFCFSHRVKKHSLEQKRPEIVNFSFVGINIVLKFVIHIGCLQKYIVNILAVWSCAKILRIIVFY